MKPKAVTGNVKFRFPSSDEPGFVRLSVVLILMHELRAKTPKAEVHYVFQPRPWLEGRPSYM